METPDDDLVLWTNPRCSKSRSAEALLAERGVVPRTVRYLDGPPARAELARVADLVGLEALVRAGEPQYRELGLAGADRDTVLDALAAHPQLIERPVALRGGRAVVARPPERVLELLD